jgi:simple sugar transport system ATP-binding protein
MSDVSLRGITKTFPGVRAVDHVSVDFHAGEIHAILGENGAGKSTLMHILSGLYAPDSGEILIDDHPHTFSSPRAALAVGVSMVHQHFMLIPSLTVAENILLALPGHTFDRLQPQHLTEYIQQLSSRYGIGLEDPTVLVATLSVGAQQRVEILKALTAEARILILDEPTAVLTPSEVASLFATLRHLKNQGYLILLITHKIPEVLTIADRLSILRRGRLVTTRSVSSYTLDELARLMVEDATNMPSPPASPPKTDGSSGQLLLDLHDISIVERGRELLRQVSLTLSPGEIVGIAGVDGNGQAQLMELLIGARLPTHGTFHLDGTVVTSPTPAKLRAKGVALIPQDRRVEGLALPLTIAENLLLNTGLLDTSTANFILSPLTMSHFAETQMARFGIQAPTASQPVATLSGGNQQRVIIARELAHNPRIIIAVNPTRGLDIAATRYVHQSLLDRCRQGVGIVLISTDLDEILSLATRTYVLYRGQLLGPIPSQAGHEVIGQMMTGAWQPE